MLSFMGPKNTTFRVWVITSALLTLSLLRWSLRSIYHMTRSWCHYPTGRHWGSGKPANVINGLNQTLIFKHQFKNQWFLSLNLIQSLKEKRLKTVHRTAYMLPQQLLTMASQSIKVVPSQFAHGQCLERGLEVVCTLKAQQGLLEITPAPDLWCRTGVKKQITACNVLLAHTYFNLCPNSKLPAAQKALFTDMHG